MRVVGGRLRGRALAGPLTAGPLEDGIRPTSDRLREAVFNVLAHAYDDPVPGSRVIDLFAGTGALGLEALSRGAVHATFVEIAGEARALIRQNVETLGLGGAARLFRRDATRLGPAAPNAPAEIAFCDPPYGRDLVGPALRSLAAGGWLRSGALVVVEREAGAARGWPEAFGEIEIRRYGETEIVFLRHG